MISTLWEIGLVVVPVVVGLLILHRGFQIADRRAGLEIPTQSLLMTTLIGLGAYLFCISAYMSIVAVHATTRGSIVLPPKQQFTLDAISRLVAILAIIVAHRVNRTDGPRKLGFSPRQFIPAIPKAIIGILFVLPAMFWVARLTMWFWDRIHFHHDMKHEMLQFLDTAHDPASKWLIIISAAVIAPLAEEMVFRGHLQTIIRQVTRSSWGAILITSVLFAIVHPVWTRPPIFFLAICLGYIYERTGNLWTSIFLHAAFNGFNIIGTLYGTL